VGIPHAFTKDIQKGKLIAVARCQKSLLAQAVVSNHRHKVNSLNTFTPVSGAGNLQIAPYPLVSHKWQHRHPVTVLHIVWGTKFKSVFLKGVNHLLLAGQRFTVIITAKNRNIEVMSDQAAFI